MGAGTIRKDMVENDKGESVRTLFVIHFLVAGIVHIVGTAANNVK